MLREMLRQLAIPAEFRIAPPTVEVSTAPPSPMAGSDDPLVAVADQGGRAPSVQEASRGVADSVLPDLCTGLWRLRRRMTGPGTDRPVEEMKRPFRHLESVWSTLAEAGVEIRDHTDEDVPAHGSLGLSVLAYQPMPGFTSERVIETVRPSVYVGGQLVQMGQVIIGTPENASGEVAEGEHT